MDLRFHGTFPPAYQDVPGTIAAKPKPEEVSEHEPLCLLQVWTDQRDGKTAYMFLMYALQSPPHEIAKRIANYFHITPARGGYYDFIEVTPPNAELLRPVFSRFNFKWEWQHGKWIKRGSSWVWQDAGYSVILPYSESELLPAEEAQYTEQLTGLMVEAEHQAVSLPQPKQRLLLPVFARSSQAKNTGLAIGEKATATN
jgi:hypothetical protein